MRTLAGCLALFSWLCTSSAGAFSSGVSTSHFGADGCNTCHTGGATPTVSFRDGSSSLITSLSVSPGSYADLYFRIEGGQNGGGFNVSRSSGASNGNLSANDDSGVRSIFGTTGTEVTHSARRPYSSGYAEFGFRFTVPDTVACGTTTTLQGWGNSDDGGSTSGDRAATTTLTITIACQANGSTCTRPTQCASGYCVDGYCCNQACVGICEACAVAQGALEDGVCRPVSPTSPRSSLCAPFTCPGTSASCRSSCTSELHCAADARCDSSRGICVGLLPQGALCGRAFECATGECVDGRCCDLPCAGDCQACSAIRGATADGTCTTLPSGTEATECDPYLCGGGTSCSTTCFTSIFTWLGCAAGHYCRRGACVALSVRGAACSSAEECATGECVDGFCCDTACRGACEGCAAARGAAADGTCTVITGMVPACSPYVCVGAGASCPTDCTGHSGCISTHFCSDGSCVEKHPEGAPCDDGFECASGSCVDGVCCDGLCDGQCEACDVAGSEGSCVAVAGAPHGGREACASDATACGGACDGSDREACAYPDATVLCRAAECAASASGGSIATLAAFCDGAGRCPPEDTQSCGAYACDGSICGGDCSEDADCDAGHFCNAGVCVAQRADGEACTATNACTSGSCVDGVCCDGACSGQCEACDLPGAEGTCTASPEGAPRGGRPACAGAGACQGRCDGVGRTECEVPLGSEELCNGEDDDCDGEVDESTLCEAGEVCEGAAGCQMRAPDAGGPTVDAGRVGLDGGAADAGAESSAVGACGCRVQGSTPPRGALTLLGLVLLARGVRRRARRR